MFHFPKGTTIYSRDKKLKGVVVGHRLCTLEGCWGMRLIVKWPDGKRTHPCSKGLAPVESGAYKIE
jgi:hypothetical protein